MASPRARTIVSVNGQRLHAGLYEKRDVEESDGHRFAAFWSR
jgi:hypothetical protein